ncbi:hypothetical protein ACFX11_008243 [Malus domestica]
MALKSRFLFATSSSMLLFSLLVIASAKDYSSGAPRPKVDEYPELPKVDGYPELPKVDIPNLPNAGKPKPEVYAKLKPQTIGIQGLVLCKSGLQSFPIKGAVVRITCLAEDEQGYETAPFSKLSGATDAKGYFFATLSPSQLEDKWKLTECKAFLDYSPLEACKVPTDVNHGITGHLLSSYRALSAKNIKLITCEAVDQYGFETAPVTVVSDATDAKGYFFATMCPPKIDNKKQLTKCKAFLELSSSESCNVPTDSNNGISGPVLASYRLLHDKNIKPYANRMYLNKRMNSTEELQLKQDQDLKEEQEKTRYIFLKK